MLRRTIIIINLAILCLVLNGQMTNTLYFMDKLPQSNQLNPAFQPNCNVFIAFPAFQTNVGNNSLSLSDIYFYNSKVDSLITIFHDSATKGDRDRFIGNLKDENSAFNNMQVDVLSFGFRIKDWYFTFGTSLKTDFRTSYPRDLMKMLVNGIDTASLYNFKYFGVNATAYGEASIGVARKINDAWSVGVRGKVLNGLFDVSTQGDKFELNSSVDPLHKTFRLKLESDMTINGSVPFVYIPDTATDFSKMKISEKADDYMPIMKNAGFAADFGATFNGINKLTLSASVLDFGLIRWNQGVYNLKMKGNYTFSDSTLKFNTDSFEKAFDGIGDSITNAFKFTQKHDKYSTWLPTKICIGAEYTPLSFLSVGVMSLSQYYKSTFTQQFVLSANLRALNMFTFSTSYSVFDNGFSNMGLGLSMRLGFFQYYFVADNIPVSFGKVNGIPIVPYKLRSFNMRTGVNIVFGNKGNTAKKKEAEKPFISD